MPCRNDGWEHESRQSQQAELDKVTRLLCEVLGNLHRDAKKRNNYKVCNAVVSPHLAIWYREHLRLDKEREDREKAEEDRQRKIKMVEEYKKQIGLI